MASDSDIWVTPRACSVCRSQHTDDGHGDECDHWCHGAGAEDWEVDGDGE